MFIHLLVHILQDKKISY